MYRHVVVVRPGGWYEKVNGVEITWNTCAKPPIIIAYAYSIFFSGVSSLKKKFLPTSQQIPAQLVCHSLQKKNGIKACCCVSALSTPITAWEM